MGKIIRQTSLFNIGVANRFRRRKLSEFKPFKFRLELTLYCIQHMQSGWVDILRQLW